MAVCWVFETVLPPRLGSVLDTVSGHDSGPRQEGVGAWRESWAVQEAWEYVHVYAVIQKVCSLQKILSIGKMKPTKTLPCAVWRQSMYT